MPQVWGYASDKRIRDENQDNFGVFDIPLGLLAIVCDGMGGHAGGSVASTLAVRAIQEHLSTAHGNPQEELKTAIELANRAVYDQSRKSRQLMGMGTTVVAAIVSGNTLFVAHVGDSRAYFTRGGEAESITRDHTMVNLFVDAELLSPEDAASHPEAHVLARSLGVERSVEVDAQDALPFEDGDAVILCSDGVHSFISDEEFGGKDWREPQVGIEELFKLLRERESDDNATMVVLCAEGNAGVVSLPLTDVSEFDLDIGTDTGPRAVIPDRSTTRSTEPITKDMPTSTEHSQAIEYEEIRAPAPMNIEIGLGEPAENRAGGAHPLAPEPPGRVVQESYTIGSDVDDPVTKASDPERDLSKAKPVRSNRSLVLLGGLGLVGMIAVLGAGGLYVMLDEPRPVDEQVAMVEIEEQVEAVPAEEAPTEDATPPVPELEAEAPTEDATPPVPELEAEAPEGELGIEVAIPEGVAAADTEPENEDTEPGSGDLVEEVQALAEQLDVAAPSAPEAVPRENDGLADAAVAVELPAGAGDADEDAAAAEEEQGVAWLGPRVSWARAYDDSDPGFQVRVRPPNDDVGGFYIQAQKPDLGRRAMHRAETYVNAPPGGSQQNTIVMSSREGECGASMAALDEAMTQSLDFASLYNQVWSCYNISHQRRLFGMSITSTDTYAEQVWHLEGKDRPTKGYYNTPWAAPAMNGLDHRLERWMDAEGKHSFSTVILDLVGQDQVAADLTADLLIEAEAAAAFGRVSQHTEAEVDYWARRVYVAARAFLGTPGTLVAEHHPDSHAMIRGLLNEATRGGMDNPRGVSLPSPVKDALLTALGEKELRPVSAPKPKPKPNAPVPEEQRPVIYQGPAKR